MSESEIKRVLTNPDNLIVSDSLVGRIDFGEDPEPEISASLSCNGKIIVGKFLCYSIKTKEPGEEEVSVTFLAPEHELTKAMEYTLDSDCLITIKSNTINGKVFKMELDLIKSELQITVFLKRYI